MKLETLSRLAKIKAEMKQSSRYPHTYAADMLRASGVAKSRSEAAQYAIKNDLNQFNLADAYVEIWALRRLADEIEGAFK